MRRLKSIAMFYAEWMLWAFDPITVLGWIAIYHFHPSLGIFADRILDVAPGLTHGWHSWLRIGLTLFADLVVLLTLLGCAWASAEWKLGLERRENPTTPKLSGLH